jgi:cellulose synthase/poly-beta-1,6-N-acetylglucosamine synthase-like glycosyltransferase
MILLGYTLTVLSALLLLPAAVFLIQVLASLLPQSISDSRTSPSAQEALQPSTCVLMPAHNEATGIAQVLQVLLPQLPANFRLLVVADNCTDETADIVRAVAAGRTDIEVIERHNPALRGKGYALDHGVRYLETNPPQVVVVMDADCEFADGGLVHLAHQCLAIGRAQQALYLMRAPAGAGVKVCVAEFAWLVKNQVRALGDYRMGFPCQLMGTGMAFPWAQIQTAQLGTGHIVEDMKLSVELTQAGTPPVFFPHALVTSQFPSTAVGLKTQRTRWEHGHLGVILGDLPIALWQAVRHKSLPLLALALNLSVPPLTLLVLLLFAQILAASAYAFVSGIFMPFGLAVIAGVAVIAAVFIAWLVYARHIVTLRQLSSVPLYVASKLPVYLYFLVKRQAAWVRSFRDGE